MYNFFERIKAPLTEFRKKDPYKKDDDLENSNNIGSLSNTILGENNYNSLNTNDNSNNNNNGMTEGYLTSSNNINIVGGGVCNNNNINNNNNNVNGIPVTNTVVAPIPSLPISILKQSQLIGSINPLGSSSPRTPAGGGGNGNVGAYFPTINSGHTGNHSQSPNTITNIIPQSPIINSLGVSSSSILNQQQHQQQQIPTIQQHIVPNVIAVPIEISEVTSNTPITIVQPPPTPTHNSTTCSSLIGSPILNQTSSNVFSSHYSIQQAQAHPQTSYNHQMPSSLGHSTSLLQQQQNQQLLQHLSNLHQNHQNQYQPPISPTLFSQQQQQQNHSHPHSHNRKNSTDHQQHQFSLGNSGDIEMKEIKKSTGAFNFSHFNSPKSFSNHMNSNNSSSNISASGRFSKSKNSTDQFGYYYNPNSLNQSTINVVTGTSNGHQQQQQQQHDRQYISSSSSMMMPINENNGANVDNGEQQVEILKIPKIPKKKSRFNKEKMKKFKTSVYQILSPETQLPIHIVDNEQMENTVIPFLMELGRALLMAGVPAHRLEYELTLISGTFGIDGHFFTTPTGIFFSFGSPHTILSPYTHFLRINSTDYNMNRLILLEQLADQVIYGHLSCADGLIRLKEILRLKPLYNHYLTVISFVLSSFAIAFFFKAGWVEVGACSFVGLYVGLLNAVASKYATIGRVLEALSACGGAILASLFNSFVYPVHIFLVTLGGIIALAPGLSLTLAVAEISTRNLISGNARLVGVFSCLLQLTFGIALGTRVSAKILPIQIEIDPLSLPSWTMFLAVPIAAVSFAVQMKVHPKQIWVIMLASALGILCGNWGNKFFGEDVGSFFGSCAICMLGNLYARLSNTSAAVPIMAGIILLVPGSMGIKGLVALSGGKGEEGIQFFEGMFMIAASLTVGLLVANLIIKPNKAL